MSRSLLELLVKTRIITVLVMLGILCVIQTHASDSTSDTALGRFLRENPESDTDKDGILTQFEYEGYLPQSILSQWPEGSTHLHAMIAMRDGVQMATEVFMPQGKGPWPVVLIRTPYGRWRTGGYAKQYRDDSVVFVAQDLRGSGDSQGKDTFKPSDFAIEMADSQDTVAWLGKQVWCNGRVAMTGGSGHGMAAAMAYWSRSPQLVAVMPGNTAGHGNRYWLYHNAVRRWTYRWLSFRNGSTRSWPRPTINLTPVDDWQQKITEAAQNNPTFYANSTGWFDVFSQGALDDFGVIAQAGGKAFVTISPTGHGGVSGLTFPKSNKPVRSPQLADVLHEKNQPPARPTLLYYLMGDVKDKDAPGNCWQVAHQWPVNSLTRNYYLQDEALQTAAPASPGNRTYQYDPAKPAPSLGGHYAYAGKESGPHDQRPLLNRDDVLGFQSEPLAEPLPIVGRLQAELYIESDAPDTMFVVKIVDVYPDGYMAVLRESAVMARFGDDLATASPLTRGEIRKLVVDLWSTAYVINRGHRLGVIITSASDPAYEVHPNTYEQVKDASGFKVANNRIHWSTQHPSHITLPLAPEVLSR